MKKDFENIKKLSGEKVYAALERLVDMRDAGMHKKKRCDVPKQGKGCSKFKKYIYI